MEEAQALSRQSPRAAGSTALPHQEARGGPVGDPTRR
uniref:Uncharacterized protein n=1 Tax=Arundo donax TaxID=35708 RepID=A0A0A8Z2B4_ARUDO